MEIPRRQLGGTGVEVTVPGLGGEGVLPLRPATHVLHAVIPLIQGPVDSGGAATIIG